MSAAKKPTTITLADLRKAAPRECEVIELRIGRWWRINVSHLDVSRVWIYDADRQTARRAVLAALRELRNAR